MTSGGRQKRTVDSLFSSRFRGELDWRRGSSSASDGDAVLSRSAWRLPIQAGRLTCVQWCASVLVCTPADCLGSEVELPALAAPGARRLGGILHNSRLQHARLQLAALHPAKCTQPRFRASRPLLTLCLHARNRRYSFNLSYCQETLNTRRASRELESQPVEQGLL
jgi:hypothetical protein